MVLYYELLVFNPYYNLRLDFSQSKVNFTCGYKYTLSEKINYETLYLSMLVYQTKLKENEMEKLRWVTKAKKTCGLTR
jgi:hypothetical protein